MIAFILTNYLVDDKSLRTSPATKVIPTNNLILDLQKDLKFDHNRTDQISILETEGFRRQYTITMVHVSCSIILDKLCVQKRLLKSSKL